MNPITFGRIAIAASLCLTAVGCQKESPAAEARTTPEAGKLAGDDLAFFAKAAQTDMAEIAAAGLATSRATAAGVKTYATQLETDHRKASADLKALADRKEVVLPTQLDEAHQKMIDELGSVEAGDFDERYAEAMEKGHGKAVDLYTETARDSKDADVRAYATALLPTLKSHHDMAEALEDAPAAAPATP